MHKDAPTLEHRVIALKQRIRSFQLRNPQLYPNQNPQDYIDKNVASITQRIIKLRSSHLLPRV